MSEARFMAIASSRPQGQFTLIRCANYLLASSIATATATVIPTIGLLPAPMSPIISTLQGALAIASGESFCQKALPQKLFGYICIAPQARG